MWHEYGHGGHFPAAAEPELLAQTLREGLGAALGRRERWDGGITSPAATAGLGRLLALPDQGRHYRER